MSHDRWFLSQTCERIVAIEKGKVETYEGDFRYYMDSNEDYKKKIENHYQKDSTGIQSVPYSRKELELGAQPSRHTAGRPVSIPTISLLRLSLPRFVASTKTREIPHGHEHSTP